MMGKNKTIKFEDIKPRLLQALKEKGTSLGIQEKNGVTLINGFINQPLQKKWTGGLVVGGPSIPMVAVVGNSSGRIYLLALKALLPDIEL